MKKLFIYYSFTGNGDIIADKLSKYNIDVRKIETKQKLPKLFFFQMIVGGFKALIKYKDKLFDYDKDISSYDEIVIGTPIWFDRISSPINRVLSDLDIKDKKVSFIFYSASGVANKASERINKEYEKANILVLKTPFKTNEQELDKLNIYE